MAYSDVRRRTVKISLPPGRNYVLEDFTDWAESTGLDPEDFVAGGPLRSNSVWHFTLATVEAVDKVLEDAEVQVAGNTGRISHVDEKFVEVKVHWLPFYIEDGLLMSIFEEYGTIMAFSYSKPLAAQSNSFFKDTHGLARHITLRTDRPLESLPYTIKVKDGEQEAVGLVAIRGRAPRCFRCGELGHERRECPLQFCTVCRVYHAPNGPDEICKGPTYADMMRRRRMEGVSKTATGSVSGGDGKQEGSSESDGSQQGVDGGSQGAEGGRKEDGEKEKEKDSVEEVVSGTGRKEEGEQGEQGETVDGEAEGQDRGAEGNEQEAEEGVLGSSLPCHNAMQASQIDRQEREESEQQPQRLVDLVKSLPYLPEHDPILDASMDSEASSLRSPPASPARKMQKV